MEGFLLLPKGYLSWSAYSMWKSSPERYKKEYFLGSDRLDTRFLRFGKSIASQIEEGTHHEILPNLKVYPEVEFQINVDVLGVPILSYLDSYDPANNIFREYKTGLSRNPWTAVKVQKHGQLLFYAVALRALFGKMPEYCHLDWIITQEIERGNKAFDKGRKDIRITKEIKSFKRTFDERELDKMESELLQAAQDISVAYREFIQNLI